MRGRARRALIDRAHPYRTNAGHRHRAGDAAPVALTDFLDQKRAGAPAGEVPRGPYTVRALRIGKSRDGSKPGVSSRRRTTRASGCRPRSRSRPPSGCVRNYAHDGRRRRSSTTLDIFLIPSNNPDGGELLLLQLRLAAPEHDEPLPGRHERRSGGGATPGASTSTATTASARASTATTARRRAAPRHLPGPVGAVRAREQERRSGWPRQPEHQVLDEHAQLRATCSWSAGGVHRPGAGSRLPRPPLGHEAFFWAASTHILSEIKRHRNMAVDARSVGPVIGRPLLRRRQLRRR